jgi:hypothetical protein
MRFVGLATGVWLLGAAQGLAAPLALVIGNEAYTGMPALPSCGASAGLVARKLAAAGYAVTSAANLSNGGMDGAVGDFALKASAETGAPALVYVCAYGASLETRDFILPVSAQVAQPSDLRTEGVLARGFLAAGRGGRKAPLLIALDLVRDPAGALPPAGGAMAREALPDGVGVIVVAESRPPSAPTAFAGALAAAVAGGTLAATTLSLVAGQLPPGGDGKVAGLQDAKTAATAAAVPAPVAAAPGAAAMPDDAAMTEADRRRVQIALAGLGYYDGRLDGVFGPDTRAAIRRWQHEKGAEMTGRLTAGQATALASGK